MNGIQFVTDEKGWRVAVQIDLKKHAALWQDIWDGIVSDALRNEKGIPYQEYCAKRPKRGRSRNSIRP